MASPTKKKTADKIVETRQSAAKPAKAAAKPAAKASANKKTGDSPGKIGKEAKPAQKAAAKPRKTASAASARPPLAPEQYRCYVEVAAYYIAERRGFQGGSALADWAQAEAEIDRLLSEGILNP